MIQDYWLAATDDEQGGGDKEKKTKSVEDNEKE